MPDLVGPDDLRSPCTEEFPLELSAPELLELCLGEATPECPAVVVKGHSDESYNGMYDLQRGTKSGRSWFQKPGPEMRALYFSGGADVTESARARSYFLS